MDARSTFCTFVSLTPVRICGGVLWAFTGVAVSESSETPRTTRMRNLDTFISRILFRYTTCIG